MESSIYTTKLARRYNLLKATLATQEKHNENAADKGFIDENMGSETPHLAEGIITDEVSSLAKVEQNDSE